MNTNRRSFLQAALTATLAPAAMRAQESKKAPLFKISLAEWSFHRTLGKGLMKNIDFPVRAKEFGFDGVEWVNQFWKDKAKDTAYLAELKKIVADNGLVNVLIMCDNEGLLGDPDETGRAKAVENHRKWVEAARFLGCHSIRVNAHTGEKGTPEEQAKRVTDGLAKLCDIGAEHGLNVIVENHGGLSSNGDWLTGVIKATGKKNAGTLPDFGNFQEYDRYKGTDQMMPFAKGVSAKSHDFDDKGNETHTDYRKMIDIVVKKNNYHGFLGVEYEGSRMSEVDGLKATKALLETIRTEMSA